MKKTKLLLMCAITLLMGACTESSFENHFTGFIGENVDGKHFYADQSNSSTRLRSLDPWTAEATFLEGTTPWFDITPKSNGAPRPGTSIDTLIKISFDQNTTGKNRRGYVTVSTYDNQKVALPVKQEGWLDIRYPNPTITNMNDYEKQEVRFEMTAKSKNNNEVISFHVYQDNATLKSNSPWLKSEETTFQKGYHSVRLIIEPNEDDSPREAVLTLTSGMVSTPIYVKQEAKKNN